MNNLILLLFCFTFTFLTYGQNSSESDFDLPPGTKMMAKIQITDYSPKLEDIHTLQVIKSNYNMAEHLSIEDLAALQDENHPHYNYMNRLEAYYDDLSPRVKTAFTFQEIWNIFAFDKKLKETLLTIK